MHDTPRPTVAVIKGLDWPRGVCGFRGEVRTTVQTGSGPSGMGVPGVARDPDHLPERFPVIAGSVRPSHGLVHVRQIDQPPVQGMELTVHPAT